MSKFGLKKTCSFLRAMTRKKIVMATLFSLFATYNSPVQAEIMPTIDSNGGLGLGSAYEFGQSTDNNSYEISTFDAETNTINTQSYSVNIKDNVESGSRIVTDGNGGSSGYNGTYADQFVHHFDYTTGSNTATSAAIGAGIFNCYKNSVINTIVGDYINLAAISNTANAHGVAIDNHGVIGTITGDFIGNHAHSIASNAWGGVINNVGTGSGYSESMGNITSITGNFISNSLQSDNGYVYGGAININQGWIGSINGIFIGNKAVDAATTGIGGAIILQNNSSIDNLQADFVKNVAKTHGGALSVRDSEIANINGNFAGNEAIEGNGGAIYNVTSNNGATITDKTSVIGNINGTFYSNKAGNDGGAIYNTNGAQIEYAEGDFIANEAGNNGGAIYNDSTIADGSSIVVDGNFLNNKATGSGGAIYSKSDIDLLANGHSNVIHGNTSGSGEAIYMEGAPAQEATYDDTDPSIELTPAVPAKIPNLNLKTDNNGEWVIYDRINGTEGLYNVNMTGGGTVSLYNDINGGNVTLDGTRLNTVNNDIHVYNVNEFTVKGDSSIAVDFDIKNEQMDRITTADGESNYAGNSGTLDVVEMNFLNDTKKNKASVLFAEPELAHRVLNHGKAEGEIHKIVTPARLYDIQYNVHNDDNRGYFEFSSNWNPAVLAAPVVLQTGIQSAMNTTIQYAFNHLDTYTKIPKFDRLTMMQQNKYAAAVSSDFNSNLTSLKEYNLRENRTSNQGIWFRPYVAFENIKLKNGPKVDSITYGSFLGFDSDFHEHRNGWHSVWSTYLGYQGGQIDYTGVDANLNGGVLGITDTFYKNNFWTAVTLTGGAMFADISTMYGHEDATSIAAALATKTGYNFEFKDGKYILQPILKASYSFANMFDYTNAAGLRIDAKPLHTIQLNPSLRFITNCRNGWQPYVRAGMVWNLMNDTDVDAGAYHLPNMHIKPYFEYGLGVQKLYNHRFVGFGQAMLRHGGRNGIALTFGLRYGLGREPGVDYKNMTKWERFKAFFK